MPDSGAYAMLAARLFRTLGVIEHSGMDVHPNASKGEMGVLGLLAGMGRSMAPTELAEHLGISTSRTANALKTLESKGYITRVINPDDRRGILVSITDSGLAFAREKYEETAKSIAELISLISVEDAEELVRITSKLEDKLVEERGVFRPPLKPLV